jgi:hypothetical protein
MRHPESQTRLILRRKLLQLLDAAERNTKPRREGNPGMLGNLSGI